MSKVSDVFKMILLKMAIPTLEEEGSIGLHDVLAKLAVEKPKLFALAMQILYPAVKGVLQPLVHYTKTEFDDGAGDTAVDLLDNLAAELGIKLPDVTPLDFNAPDLPDAPIV